MTDITKIVAKIRFNYHGDMLNICNVANQLGILKDEKAEKLCKFHAMNCFDALERLGYDLSKLKK